MERFGSMIRKRLDALRRLMKENKIDAYLTPGTDAHQSEYVPACWQRRTWISGFTGSAGNVVVGMNHAGLWTDARYFLQAEQELKGSGITLFKEGVAGTPDWIGWIKGEIYKGGRIGADPRLLTAGETEKLTKELAVSPHNNVASASAWANAKRITSHRGDDSTRKRIDRRNQRCRANIRACEQYHVT